MYYKQESTRVYIQDRTEREGKSPNSQELLWTKFKLQTISICTHFNIVLLLKHNIYSFPYEPSD